MPDVSGVYRWALAGVDLFKILHRGSVNPTPAGSGTSIEKIGAARLIEKLLAGPHLLVLQSALTGPKAVAFLPMLLLWSVSSERPCGCGPFA